MHRPGSSRSRYVLRVVTDEPRQRVELLHRNIRRHGTIFNTLAAVCEVTGDIIAEPTGSAPQWGPCPLFIKRSFDPQHPAAVQIMRCLA
jgi:hypothetical protein